MLNSKIQSTHLLASSKKFAFWSFLIGTLLLLTFYLSKSIEIAVLGFFYVCITALLNGGLLIRLIFEWINQKQVRYEISKVIALILINIPVAILYYKVALWILGNLSDE